MDGNVREEQMEDQGEQAELNKGTVYPGFKY